LRRQVRRRKFGNIQDPAWRISTESAKKISAEIGKAEYLDFAEKELKFCEKNGISIQLRHLNDLPKLLSECEDAPAILYQKGNPDWQKSAVSIVGTRNITAYGKQFISDLISALPAHNSLTVSGLALGADTEVHAESIKNKIPTVAVLAHGFHTLYPSKNRQLSEKILEENGALITEFNSSQKPDREKFYSKKPHCCRAFSRHNRCGNGFWRRLDQHGDFCERL